MLKDGNVEVLRDSHVELESETDATVRGSGLIEADGRFNVEMLHQGQILHGLPTGRYRARIIISDEAPSAKKARSLVARRYLDFKTADLSITVPATQEVSLTIASK